MIIFVYTITFQYSSKNGALKLVSEFCFRIALVQTFVQIVVLSLHWMLNVQMTRHGM